MKKYVAGAGLAAALLTGSVAIAGLNPIGFASAQDATTTEPPTTESPTTESPTTESPTTEAPSGEATPTPTPAPDEGAAPADGERGSVGFGPLSRSLDELVAEGVITQEQADAIRDRVDAKRDEWKAEHPGKGPGGRDGFGGFTGLRESTQAVADALGLSVEDLISALGDGSSLNDLAAEKGVDPAAISQILVDAANTRIDQGVADGKITQEKADELKAKISESVGKAMDGSLKGLGRFGRGTG